MDVRIQFWEKIGDVLVATDLIACANFGAYKLGG